MTWLCILLGIALGNSIVLTIRSIKHISRINYLQDKDFIHTNRLNIQQVRIEELEEELNNLKKGNK